MNIYSLQKLTKEYKYNKEPRIIFRPVRGRDDPSDVINDIKMMAETKRFKKVTKITHFHYGENSGDDLTYVDFLNGDTVLIENYFTFGPSKMRSTEFANFLYHVGFPDDFSHSVVHIKDGYDLLLTIELDGTEEVDYRINVNKPEVIDPST